MTRRRFACLLLAAALTAACGTDGGDGGAGQGTTTSAGEAAAGSLTVYSGRSENLVGPLIAQFEDETGIDVEVRYCDTAEMAGAILEEGENSPADVYYGQDAGALGALSAADRLAPLDQEVLDRVDPQFRSPEGEWVGVSGRARVVVYNTDALSEDDLPDSILGFTDPKWKGKIGWAPTNGSFQAFVTALRVLEGEEGARAWLEGIAANEPKVYENNSSIVKAVAAGEVPVGFVNHYYLFQLGSTGDDVSKAANKYYTDGDPGALVNVAGVGVVDTADNTDAAGRFVRFLLDTPAQEYFAAETFEIPLVEGVAADPALPDLESLQQPDLDLSQLEDLEGTQELLTEVGVV